MTRMGVKVDLIGNILGKNKPTTADGDMPDIDGEAEVVSEDANKTADEDKPVKVSKPISKPKPKKSKKKK
jgi:hypothetical protein